ncbi:50S ribosomal protein L28 [candidate division WWE3 bacterium CG08_land_8_20_14_0_20_40_13]|uniref:50S ribosomal protein L28 n=1 Tax=candidate division WWE3 bacterium CG08_land_8_20_14_0_20_40_13 TaxID=1975084 RepID=A0A2H0XES9_UNCKA|nr:MAG: 50S ribosomal protein L28 [candidate division WWE3 bacterium CG08_land_8_20_14_0_20_40_13]
MSRICENCQKSRLRGKQVTDAWGVSYRSNKHFGVNLRNATLTIGGVKKRIKVCAKCLKSLKASLVPVTL